MLSSMKLGVFDSGLGGILIAKSIREAFPDIDMVYLGDTLHLPYGNRSEDAIYAYSKACMDALFGMGCNLIIMACNTASASALRRLQQEYLPQAYPERRILGVVVPTVEEAIERGYERIGVIATNYTVNSNIYGFELQKINPEISIQQVSTPLLVPMIEHGGEAWLDEVLASYLQEFNDIQALLLSCTHYVHLKDRIRGAYGFEVLSQDEIIPKKLGQYFDKHPEIFDPIGQGGQSQFYVTDYTKNIHENASSLYGAAVDLQILEGVHGYA